MTQYSVNAVRDIEQMPYTFDNYVNGIGMPIIIMSEYRKVGKVRYIYPCIVIFYYPPPPPQGVNLQLYLFQGYFAMCLLFTANIETQ